MALVEVRQRVRDLTNRLQGVLSNVEQNDKPKAMLAIADCMAELAKITTLVANGFLQDAPGDGEHGKAQA